MLDKVGKIFTGMKLEQHRLTNVLIHIMLGM